MSLYTSISSYCPSGVFNHSEKLICTIKWIPLPLTRLFVPHLQPLCEARVQASLAKNVIHQAISRHNPHARISRIKDYVRSCSSLSTLFHYTINHLIPPSLSLPINFTRSAPTSSSSSSSPIQTHLPIRLHPTPFLIPLTLEIHKTCQPRNASAITDQQ